MMFKTNLNVQNGVVGLFTKLPSLQFFAAGDNNDLPVKTYQPEFKELLPAVYSDTAHFTELFVGGLEVMDGVRNSATAFTIKTSDIPVVVRAYNTAPQIGFGNGTGASSRFGNRTEIVYVEQDVPYSGTWAIHEGLDRFTVNTDLEDAVLDRLELHARAKAEMLDEAHGTMLSTNAANQTELRDYDSLPIRNLFAELSAYYKNNRIGGTKIFYAVPELYNGIVDNNLISTSKNSTVNIDTNEYYMFKGFILKEVPGDLFPEGEVGFACVTNIAKTFLGINTARTIESEDFDGKALQGAGKYGSFIPNDNKKAIYKVTLAPKP